MCVRDKFSDHGHFKAFQLLRIEEWKKSVPVLEYTGARIVC